MGLQYVAGEGLICTMYSEAFMYQLGGKWKCAEAPLVVIRSCSTRCNSHSGAMGAVGVRTS